MPSSTGPYSGDGAWQRTRGPQALVVDTTVEVLEVDDVADGLRGAVVLPDLLGSVHGVSLFPRPCARNPGNPGRFAPPPVPAAARPLPPSARASRPGVRRRNQT